MTSLFLFFFGTHPTNLTFPLNPSSEEWIALGCETCTIIGMSSLFYHFGQLSQSFLSHKSCCTKVLTFEPNDICTASPDWRSMFTIPMMISEVFRLLSQKIFGSFLPRVCFGVHFSVYWLKQSCTAEAHTETLSIVRCAGVRHSSNLETPYRSPPQLLVALQRPPTSNKSLQINTDLLCVNHHG